MTLAPAVLEHDLGVRGVQCKVQRAVRGVCVADFSAAGTCDGYRGEETGAVLFEAACAFEQHICGLLGVGSHALDEACVHFLVALLGLLALWCYAFYEWPFPGASWQGVQVAFLWAEVWWNG